MPRIPSVWLLPSESWSFWAFCWGDSVPSEKWVSFSPPSLWRLSGLFRDFFYRESPSGSCPCWELSLWRGVVVNNAIVLLDVVELRRKEGKSVEEALRKALEERLRPILLTTGTTVAGLFPLGLFLLQSLASSCLGHDFRTCGFPRDLRFS